MYVALVQMARRRKSQQNSREMVQEEKTGGHDDKPPDQDKDKDKHKEKDQDQPSDSRCIPSCTILWKFRVPSTTRNLQLMKNKYSTRQNKKLLHDFHNDDQI